MGLQRVGHALVTEQQCNDCEVYSLFIGCIKQFRSVQLLSLIQLFEISCTAEHQSSLSTPNLQSLLKFMCFKLVMPYTTISSSIIPFFFCPQSLPASGSCQMSQFFSSGGQRIGASASASVLPMNIQDWFPLGGLVWFPCSPRDSQKSLPTQEFKSIDSLAFSFLYSPTLTPYMTTGKTIGLIRQTFVFKVMSLLFNMLSRLVIAFLPRNKHLVISWRQSPSAVSFGAPQIKVCPCFHCFPICLPWSDATRCHDLSFLSVEF